MSSTKSLKKQISRCCTFILWPVQVFTTAKSFKRNRVIGSRFLNRMGLHVARVVVAHVFFRFRLWLLGPLVSKGDRRAFKQDGIIIKKDFLPPEIFDLVRNELSNFNGERRERIEGSTRTRRLYFDASSLEDLPETRGAISSRLFSQLLRFATSRNRMPHFIFEELKLQGGKKGETDPQMMMHRDTYHPCTKAWLFLDDVEEGVAPHVFAPGSHRLTKARIRWEYRQSILSSDPGWKRPWDGSFRISEKDLKEITGREPLELVVPANTLVVSNVFGFHRRGDASRRGERLTLFMHSRTSPFSPLVTLFPRLAFKLDLKLAEIFFRSRFSRRQGK